MHSICARGERNIHPVIDDERHAGAGDGLVDGAGVFDHLPCRAVLVAILQDCRAIKCSRQSKLKERRDIAEARIHKRVEAVINFVHSRSSHD